MNKIYEYQIVRAVVESGSLTQAAKILNLSRSAVSKQLSTIEERLGVQLIERSTKSLSVTESGMRYYETSLGILEAVAQLEESLLEDESIEGRLSISIPNILTQSFFMDLIAKFAKQFPLVKLDLRVSDELDDLVAQQLDYSIRVGNLKDSRLQATHLGSTETIIFASKQYLITHGKISIGELVNHPLLIPSYVNLSEHPVWQRIKSVLPMGSCHWIDDANALIQLVKRGVGVGVMLDIIVRDALQDGSVINMYPEMHLGGNDITLLSHKKRYRTKRAQSFKEMLQSSVAASN